MAGSWGIGGELGNVFVSIFSVTSALVNEGSPFKLQAMHDVSILVLVARMQNLTFDKIQLSSLQMISAEKSRHFMPFSNHQSSINVSGNLSHPLPPFCQKE